MNTNFHALGVAPDLNDALTAASIERPFPIQALTIPDALAGRDLCGKAKTGSGKTLAFGLPLLQRVERAEPGRPTALVLVPTRELAGQVRDVLAPLAKVRDRTVAAVYGGTSLDRDVAALRKGVDVVIATPGRLIDLVDRKTVTMADIRILVVDEADRMADMGFSPRSSGCCGASRASTRRCCSPPPSTPTSTRWCATTCVTPCAMRSPRAGSRCRP